jgi:hypothetical protein
LKFRASDCVVLFYCLSSTRFHWLDCPLAIGYPLLLLAFRAGEGQQVEHLV